MLKVKCMVEMVVSGVEEIVGPPRNKQEDAVLEMMELKVREIMGNPRNVDVRIIEARVIAGE